MMKEITIKDIARLAAVAPSTVSLVLNGKAKQGRISARLAEKIRVIALEKGYQPNQVAVSLRTGSSKILGLIIEDISNIFFARLAKDIEDAAEKYGYKVLYCSTENKTDKGNELINLFFQSKVDGYLISPTAGMEKKVSELLVAQQPVVLIDRYFPSLQAPYVLSDNDKGASEAISFLIEKGYRAIGLVTSDFLLLNPQQRESAYTKTLKQYNIPFDPSFVLRIAYATQHTEAVQLIQDFIRDNPSMDAIFFTTNYLGLHGLAAINKLNLKIPEQMAVICFDDHDVFELYRPGITAVRQNIKVIADTAVNVLMHQLDRKSREIKTDYVIPTDFIVRDSA